MRLGKSLGLATGLLFATAMTASAITFDVVAADCDPNLGAVTGVPTAGVNPGCGLAGRDDSGAVNPGAGDYTGSLGTFYSIGLGGGIIIEVSPVFREGATIVEVTNAGSDHAESADVYVGNVADIGSMTYVGTVNNGVVGAEVTTVDVSIAGTGPWSYIALVDVSVGPPSVDGYDLDAISVAAVPVPASVLLLGAAVVGFGALRRKA